MSLADLRDRAFACLLSCALLERALRAAATSRVEAASFANALAEAHDHLRGLAERESFAQQLADMGIDVRSIRAQQLSKSLGSMETLNARLRVRMEPVWRQHAKSGFRSSYLKLHHGQEWGWRFSQVPSPVVANPVYDPYQPKRGWVYWLGYVESITGRLLNLHKVGVVYGLYSHGRRAGEPKNDALYDRMHSAKNLGAYSNIYGYWTLIYIKQVDDVDHVEGLLHASLEGFDGSGIRVGGPMKHASEQFLLDDEMTRYLTALFDDVPWCSSPWQERKLHQMLVLSGARHADDTGAFPLLWQTPRPNLVKPYCHDGHPLYPDGTPYEFPT